MAVTDVLETLEQELQFVAGRRADPGVEDLVRRRAQAVLRQAWERGELPGSTPEEAFTVRCDGRSGTATDRASGRIVLHVTLAREDGSPLERSIVLETSGATPTPVHRRGAAVAAANALARERLAVVRRVDLAPVVSSHVEETEKALDAVFEQAAATGSVLLLDEADALFAGPPQHRLRLTRHLEDLSTRTRVPYVLAAR